MTASPTLTLFRSTHITILRHYAKRLSATSFIFSPSQNTFPRSYKQQQYVNPITAQAAKLQPRHASEARLNRQPPWRNPSSHLYSTQSLTTAHIEPSRKHTYDTTEDHVARWTRRRTRRPRRQDGPPTLLGQRRTRTRHPPLGALSRTSPPPFPIVPSQSNIPDNSNTPSRQRSPSPPSNKPTSTLSSSSAARSRTDLSTPASAPGAWTRPTRASSTGRTR